VNAPIDRVFARMSDHEGMRAWPGVASAKLLTEGTPKNGLGAVRRVVAGGLTLDEKVVAFTPPHGFDYTIIRGLPVQHIGRVRLRAIGGGVDVFWTIELSSRVPLLAQVVAFALQRALGPVLRHVARSCEAL